VTRARFFSCEGLWSKYMHKGRLYNRSVYNRDLAVEHPCVQHHSAEEWDNLQDLNIKL